MKKDLLSLVTSLIRHTSTKSAQRFGKLKAFLCLGLVLSLGSAQAQGVIEWQNTIGGEVNDELYSIQQTHDGGYILGGGSLSNIFGDKTENSWGGYDYWIIKTDVLGNIQWQNTIGGWGTDFLNSVLQTADRGYLLSGSSQSGISGDKTDSSNGDFDYWIVKTDSLGNIQWQNSIGGTGADHLNSSQQTNDGGFILGGFSHSNISGDKSENSMGYADFWLVKTDSLGNIQWQNTIGGNANDGINSIIQTVDRGFILGGSSKSDLSGDKTENNIDSTGITNDFWIVKTDSLGNIQWQNTLGGNGDDQLISIQQTTDGGYILGGYSWSNISGDKTENNIDTFPGGGVFDYWIVKTDSLGNIQWQNTIGGIGDDKLKSIQQTIDGGYILGGSSYSNSTGDKTENSIGGLDYWIVKTDSMGIIERQNTIGGSNNDVFQSILQTFEGGYIIGGFSNSNISGDKTENNVFGSAVDYWIVKLTEHYNTLTGKLFIDGNSNSIQDSGETVLAYNRVSESNGRFNFSGQDGQYSIIVIDTGNYSFTPNSLNYYQALPVMHNAYFTGIFLTDSLNDFAFQPTGVFNDVCITLTPNSRFRNGFGASYIINYENAGTTTQSGSVVFFLDSTISFIYSSPAPAAVYTDSIIWNYSSLAPFQSGSITIAVNVHAGLPIGTLVHPFVRIDPVAGDANPSSNFHSWEVFTTTSFDPNDVLVDKDTLWSTQLPNPSFLEYIIRFQNTGSDTAFNVKILNPLDTSRLDLSSLEFVASSHPVNMSWLPWERNMEFKFNNILLPDSNTNETLSHGFVRYRIKPKNNLAAGDSIANYAAIYFDFNAPVITNIAVTKILLPTGISSLHVAEGKLIIYPNPAANELILTGYTLQPNGKTELHVYDVLGKEIFSTMLFAISYKLNTVGFPPGVYLIKVGNTHSRFVKQ